MESCYKCGVADHNPSGFWAEPRVQNRQKRLSTPAGAGKGVVLMYFWVQKRAALVRFYRKRPGGGRTSIFCILRGNPVRFEQFAFIILK